MASVSSEARLQQSLAVITRLLERHQVLETLTQKQEGPRKDLLEHLQHRQNLAELQKHLRLMHAADIAHVLEAMPLENRAIVWAQVPDQQAGMVFVEVSSTARESLVDASPRPRLIALLETLDPEDLAYVAEALPPDIVDDVSRRFALAERSVFEDTAQYEEHCIGHHMTRAWVSVPETDTVQHTLHHLRRLGALPPQTDRIFVVDSRNVLRGSVLLPALLLTDPATPITGVLADETTSFSAMASASDAAKAFERYDLVSAPVTDHRGKLVGRLTVDAMMDVLRDEANLRALKHAGLSGDEDLFAGPWSSARNRWPWLAVNLVTAFLVSRVVAQFEGAIQQLASLAALMPIVASIGGNTGNQTMALVIRALALDTVQASSARRMMSKELLVSLLNGAVWGLVIGAFAVALYASVALGLVMALAVVLNLVVAAAAGVAIPLVLHGAGRDPAHGSSVLLTFITDGMGFLLFLGLAAAFLLS
jgi:magnesium transporter